MSDYKKIIDALDSIVWYDGHYEWLKQMQNDLKKCLEAGETHFSCEFDLWHTETHTIYMILVGMFGDWGSSIRSGWIEDMQGCIEFIDAICTTSREVGRNSDGKGKAD